MSFNLQDSVFTQIDLKKLTGKLKKSMPEMNQTVADIFKKPHE